MAANSTLNDVYLHLNSFRALATAILSGEVRPFEQAASHLGVDISVVRRRIYALEDWFHVKLLAGRRAELALTTAGHTVLMFAERATAELIALRDDLQNNSERLRIVDESGIEGILADSYRQAIKTREQVTVEIQKTRTAGAWVQLINSGLADLAIVTGKGVNLKAYNSTVLGSISITLAIPSEHPLSNPDIETTPDRLAMEPIVELEDTCSGLNLLDHFRLRPTNPIVRTTSVSEALIYVRAGVGIALIPQFGDMPLQSLSGVVHRTIAVSDDPPKVYAIWKKDRGLSASEARFLSRVVEARG